MRENCFENEQALDAALPDLGGPRGMVESPTGRRPVRAGRESAPGGALYRGSGCSLVLVAGDVPGFDPDRL